MFVSFAVFTIRTMWEQQDLTYMHMYALNVADHLMITLHCTQHWNVWLRARRTRSRHISIASAVHIAGFVRWSCNRCIITDASSVIYGRRDFHFRLLSAWYGCDEGQIIVHFESHQLFSVQYEVPRLFLHRHWTSFVYCVIRYEIMARQCIIGERLHWGSGCWWLNGHRRERWNGRRKKNLC